MIPPGCPLNNIYGGGERDLNLLCSPFSGGPLFRYREEPIAATDEEALRNFLQQPKTFCNLLL